MNPFIDEHCTDLWKLEETDNMRLLFSESIDLFHLSFKLLQSLDCHILDVDDRKCDLYELQFLGDLIDFRLVKLFDDQLDVIWLSFADLSVLKLSIPDVLCWSMDWKLET